MLNLLFHPEDNIKEISYQISILLKLRLTSTTLFEKLQEHPYYPSMLAIHDVFVEFGVESEGYKCEDIEQILKLDLPFLVQVSKGSNGNKLFALVYERKCDKIDWYNPFNHKREDISEDLFRDFFSGYVLFFEKTDKYGDKDYKLHRRQELCKELISSFLFFSMPILWVIISTYYLLITQVRSIAPYIYSLLLLVGCCIGILLIIREYNAYNPIVRNLCGDGKKFNCDAVLSSNKSRFAGIPWSVIGSAYFGGMLSSMLVSFFDIHVFATIAYLNLLALPYIFFSIYYQKNVIRQWCPLCISVLTVIFALFLTALISGTLCSPDQITINAVCTVIVCLYISAALVFVVWKNSIEFQHRKYIEQTLKQIKYDPEVFYTLLKKEQKIDISTEGYGIILGNPKGNTHIIKVCNPYCGHCADAQVILQNMIEFNKDIKLQIIFISDPDQEYYTHTPVDYFLTLYYDGANMEDVFSKWYKNKIQDLSILRKIYGIHDQYSSQNYNNAKQMAYFCEHYRIMATPTLFVNGFELPTIYDIEDLRYLITK